MERQLARTDLTEGSITKKLIFFAIPILAGNIIQQLYNVADSVIVARFVGPTAMASVVVGGPVMMLFSSLFMGLSMGGNILIAQYRGAKQFDTLERAVNTVLALSVLMGTLISVMGVLFSRRLLVALGTPADILDNAASYIRIVFIGMAGSILYNFSNGMTRGFGDAKTPLYVLIFSCLLNICLDLFFIIVCGWGVEGAAIATAIANVVSGIFLLVRFAGGRYGVRISLDRMVKIDWSIVKLMLKLGIPSSIQSTIMAFGNLFMQTFANTFGSQYIAANGIVNQIDGFAMMPMMGMSMAVTTFVGQNIGAGYIERSKQGIARGIMISTSIAVFMGFFIFNFGGSIIHIYTDDPVVVAIGAGAMRFLAFFFSFMGINQILSGSMRGAGAAAVPAVLSVASQFIRLPMAYFLAIVPFNRAVNAAVASGDYLTIELARLAGVGREHCMGMFYSMGINMVLGAFMIFLYYKFGNWQTKGVTGRGPSSSESAFSEDDISNDGEGNSEDESETAKAQ
ncbi:MAG: MATE family efflux transporter [Oscillospiraceae bacterium]|nr:MATE family efflux transporter [Oscillospiraceae bacterium]